MSGAEFCGPLEPCQVRWPEVGAGPGVCCDGRAGRVGSWWIQCQKQVEGQQSI